MFEALAALRDLENVSHGIEESLLLLSLAIPCKPRVLENEETNNSPKKTHVERRIAIRLEANMFSFKKAEEPLSARCQASAVFFLHALN